MKYPLTNVIASRTLIWKHDDGSESQVEVRIGPPQERVFVDTQDRDWYCVFQILGLGEALTEAAFGVDSLQALSAAIAGVGTLIAASPPGKKKQFDLSELPNCGFPIMPIPPKASPARPKAKSKGKKKQ